jgi:isopentenyldiphosphate isomerase
MPSSERCTSTIRCVSAPLDPRARAAADQARARALAQDPDEPFDLYDDDGAPLGRTKPRALVHRDGDWHASVHLWLALGAPGGACSVVLQRRGRHKDTWPLYLDASATGHLAVGETRDDALREAREELGVELSPRDVSWLGVRRSVHVTGELCDRELQHVGLTLRAAELDELAPLEAELDELLAVPLAGLEALFEGRPALARRLAPGPRPAAGQLGPRVSELAPSELIPGRERYHREVLRALTALARGERPAPLERLG